MNIDLSENTKAIILLCGVLEKNQSVKQLTQSEYTMLVKWLKSKELSPKDLLLMQDFKEASFGSKIEEKRLKALIGRGTKLAFAVEEWHQNGIWIVSRSDEDYPLRYKKYLRDKAPPFLFCVGNRSLLCGGGLPLLVHGM